MTNNPKHKMEKMSIDYAAEDAKLDDEIRAMYAQSPESEASDSPVEDAGTESQETTSNSELNESTPVEDVSQEQPAQEQSEATVPESRYKNAVVAMNKAQQELADKRKQDAERDNLIQQLQSQIQFQSQQLQQIQQAQPAPPVPESATQDIPDADGLAEAREIYPEVVDPLLKIIARLEKKLSAVTGEFETVKGDVGSVKGVANRYQQSEQDTEMSRYWDAIKSQHSDVDEIAQSPDYEAWYAEQSELIKSALISSNPKDVIFALNEFRAEYPKSVPDTNQPITPKVDKLAAAKEAAAPLIKTTAKPEQKTTYTASQIEKMSREEYAKHEAAIDEAMARGEIVY